MLRKLSIEIINLVRGGMERNGWQRGWLEIKPSFFTFPCLLFFCFGTVTLLPAAGVPGATNADELTVPQSSQILTNVSQFREQTGQDYLRGCAFHLTGVVTLLDTNRNLLVLQDATGAVAINFDLKTVSVQTGQRVSIEASDASPYVGRFPDYPYRPSGGDIQGSFEAPSNWGDYHLTRMRGFLHPPATGNYTFWIASDNSSELWLSSNEDPAMVKRIALVGEGFWVNSREWSRYPSQRSETIFLRADRTYYIEAFQEQITLDDNLAVAWQGPGLNQAVIAGRYLTPCVENPGQKPFAETNGVLREYWTNYFAATLVGITGPRPYESALTAREIHLTVLGPGDMPEPRPINLHRALTPGDYYAWGEVEGSASFVATDGDSAILEVTDGQGRTQLRIANYKGRWPYIAPNQRVKVQGVCEGTHSLTGPVTPGLIWVPSERYLSFAQPETNNLSSTASVLASPVAPANTNADLGGFYGCRGVVTFSGQISNRDCLFVQDDDGGGVFIAPSGFNINGQLQVGQWVQAGGALLLGKNAPGIQPLLLRTLGWHTMPEPVIGTMDAPVTKSENGLWAEIEGVVRKINPDGLMVIAGKKGLASAWIGQTPMNVLGRYVDSTLRMRGVWSLAIFDVPVLLVPSRNFVEVEEEAPKDPFKLPLCSIVNLSSTNASAPQVHRVRVEGVTTYKDASGLFVQDVSGGARVQVVGFPSVQIGERIQVVGFPEKDGLLTEVMVRSTGIVQPLKPRESELADIVAGGHGGTLVRLKANLLAVKTNGAYQVLVMQEGQRAFETLLATNQGRLPPLLAGSRLKITGVCDLESAASLAAEKGVEENSSVGSLRIWLRSPQDVVVLNGPPWWTWKQVVALIGILFVVLLGTLLWIFLLRRRLERQEAARLMFSRQILHGQENERRRIAANLHDSLGQNLLVIKNQARLAMQPVTDETVLHQRLNEISGMASQAIEEVRQITHNLRPYQLDRLGLTQTIRAAIHRVSENSPISFASDVEDIDGLLDRESEIHVYRIVQESLNNVIKHSAATEATVVVKKQPLAISLSVRDNGQGFGAGIMNLNNPHNTGFGLHGINERARMLDGTLTVDAQPGKGVNLTVVIPVSAPKHETSNQTPDRG